MNVTKSILLHIAAIITLDSQAGNLSSLHVHGPRASEPADPSFGNVDFAYLPLGETTVLSLLSLDMIEDPKLGLIGCLLLGGLSGNNLLSLNGGSCCNRQQCMNSCLCTNACTDKVWQRGSA